MDQAEELDQISSWLKEEGLAPDSSKDDQLYLLCCRLHQTKKRLSNVTKDLEMNRSKHLAETAEVQKSLEQIRILTEQKDVLAQEIQEENEQLRKQLQHFISLQDAQISEVAKMLYQQGLTELIHSSPSEQVAYLLVERASLLETNEDPFKLMTDGNTESCLGTQAVNISLCQSTHKRAPRHLQSAWKRLFGLHKTSQSKHPFIHSEVTSLAVQASSLEKCSRLERDVEEGSRRLAMSHKEIRRLTDELESAHLTQRAYEPELQSAQQEVEQLRQEVEKLKKYDMVELRKTKELNDRLDLEIRALRNRVRFLDAEKNSLQQTVVSLQEETEELKLALQEQQEVLTGEMQVHQHKEKTDKVGYLQRKAAQVESAMQEQHQKLLVVQVKDNQAAEAARVESLQKEVELLKSALQQQLVQHQTNRDECRKKELIQSNQTCRDEHDKMTVPAKFWEKHPEIKCPQLVDHFHSDLNHKQDQKMHNHSEAESQFSRNAYSQMGYSFLTKALQAQLCKENMFLKECPGCQEVRKTLLSTQDVCESLKKEICEALKGLDKERSKYHNMKEKYKEKVCRAEQRFDDETSQRDEKINSLERKLSLCSHSLTKERELTVCITEENEKLLSERRKLLEQLNEEENNKKESHLNAFLSKCRVDCLETENEKLGNKILDMSNQMAILERYLQNIQTLRFAEELQKISNHQQIFTPQLLQPLRVTLPEIQGLLYSTRICGTQQTDLTSSSSCCVSGALSRTAELGYLNLTSTQSLSDHLDPPSALMNSENTTS